MKLAGLPLHKSNKASSGDGCPGLLSVHEMSTEGHAEV